MTINLQDFQAHSTGRRFADVVGDSRLPFHVLIDFFNRTDVARRMRESEIHHDRSALAGAVREFERLDEVDAYFRGHDAHTTQRTRQAIGVLVLMHMEATDWEKTGRKASLGRRVKVAPGTTTPGAYYNRTGISRWFTQAERYVPTPASTDWPLWNALHASSSTSGDAENGDS